MKRILFVFVSLSLAIITGCRHDSQNSIMSKAESFLPLQPDSADACLNSVDKRQLMGDDEKAFYALLRTMTDVLLDKEIVSDTLIGMAYNHFSYQKNISKDQAIFRHYAQSALYMGDWYSSQDSVKLSEDCYRQAIKYSEEVEDWHTCYLAYERLAEQVQWGNDEEALKLIEKGIQIYGKCNDKIENLLSLYAYAAHYSAEIAYRDKSDFQKALDYAYKAYNLATDSCLNSYYDQSLASLAEIYWEMGDYQKALDFAKKIRITELNSEYSLTLNMKIAQYYLSCDSVAKAKELCLAPKNVESKNLAYLYARELAEISVKQQNPDSIILYMDSAFSFSEDMFLEALKAKDDYLRETLVKEQENAHLTYKNRLRIWIFGISLGFFIIGGLLVLRLLLLRIRIHKEQQAHQEEESRHLQKELQLINERQLALTESYKKKTATIKHLQRYIIDRTDVAMKLKDGGTRVKMSPKEWTDVEQLLDEIDNKRISRLRAEYKELTIEDIRLCVMVRLGMSNPAIGKAYGITPSAVQHRKQTLKKKKMGVSDPNITLDDFIESL